MKRVQLFTLIAVGLILAVIAFNVWPETVIHPTLEGTDIRDYGKPSIVIEDDGTGYQTLEGTTNRDWSKPGFVVEPQSDYSDWHNDNSDYEF